MNPPRTYLSYLLRLWRSDEHAPWRASLEEARTHEQHTFAEPDRLFAFLCEQMLAAPEETDPTNQDQIGGKA
jgi:hypothetical protein